MTRPSMKSWCWSFRSMFKLSNQSFELGVTKLTGYYVYLPLL